MNRREKLNSQQIPFRFKINSVSTPHRNKRCSIGVQLKETKQERFIQNYDKYERLWKQFEN